MVISCRNIAFLNIARRVTTYHGKSLMQSTKKNIGRFPCLSEKRVIPTIAHPGWFGATASVNATCTKKATIPTHGRKWELRNWIYNMTKTILGDILLERVKQDRKWGIQNHNPEWWMQILMEEVGEAARALLEGHFGAESAHTYREEMIQVAAVAIAAIESFDRNLK